MNIIVGNEITNFSTNLPLNDYPLYSNTTTYNIGDKVTLEDKNYICTANKVLDKNPKTYENSLWVGSPINAKAMFYAKADARTKFNTPLICEFDTTYADKICFFGVKAENIKIEISSASWGNRVIEDNLRVDLLNNFADYLYGKFSYKSILEYSFSLLYAGHIKITIDPKNLAGEVSYILVGKEEYIGRSMYGGRLGLKSFTKKERNVWGDMSIKKGNIYNTLDVPIHIEEHEIDNVYSILKRVDATPCVFSADPLGRKENLRVLGTCKDLEIPLLSYSSTYNLRIESII